MYLRGKKLLVHPLRVVIRFADVVERSALVSLLTRRPGRSAFTLVEMLVVIAVIGILAAALLPAVFSAIARAKVTSISQELTNLSQAIEVYKTKRGDFPPDFSNLAAVSNHLLKSYRGNTVSIGMLQAAPFDKLDPAEALVFWLSRTASDPRNPFNTNGDRITYFDFDASRLVDLDGDGWQEYLPRNVQNAPYVYFDGRAQQAVDASSQSISTNAYFYAVYPPEWSPLSGEPVGTRPLTMPRSGNPPAADSASSIGVVRPFRSNTSITNATTDTTYPGVVNAAVDQNNTTWIAPGKYQIVSSGMDGRFGVDNMNGAMLVFKKFPAMNYYLDSSIDRSEDDDNITSFSEGKLIDKLP